jgi:hypothetical protein
MGNLFPAILGNILPALTTEITYLVTSVVLRVGVSIGILKLKEIVKKKESKKKK